MASPIKISDQAIINLSGIILPSEISKAFSGLAVAYTPASDTECWYYKLTNVTLTSGNIIGGENFISKGGLTRGTDIGTEASRVSVADKVKFLFIVHSGLSDSTGTSTNDSIYLTFSGGTAAHNGTDSIEIGSKECWYGKMNNTVVGDINAISGIKAGGVTGSGKISCFVAEFIEDV